MWCDAEVFALGIVQFSKGNHDGFSFHFLQYFFKNRIGCFVRNLVMIKSSIVAQRLLKRIFRIILTNQHGRKGRRIHTPEWQNVLLIFHNGDGSGVKAFDKNPVFCFVQILGKIIQIDHRFFVQPGVVFPGKDFLDSFIEFFPADLFFGNGCLDHLDAFRHIFREKENVVSCQQCLYICFSRLKVLAHSLHIEGIGENQSFKSQVFPKQIGDDFFG